MHDAFYCGELRARVLVLTPELEIWLWSDSPNLDRLLGWENRTPSLREELHRIGWLSEGAPKPQRPKEALGFALRKAGKPRPAALFRAVARDIGLARCTDPTFLKLRELLRSWFPRAT